MKPGICIIKEQVRYCIVNDNIENLFRNAPEEVWEEFRECKRRTKPHQQEFEAQKGPIPISFVTNNCTPQGNESSIVNG
jgi:hypothetical protein